MLYRQWHRKSLWDKHTPQIQYDLLRLSSKLGYNDKLEYYQNLFGIKYTPSDNASELILFIEDGTIPSRDEDVKYFTFDTISKSIIDNTLNGMGNNYSFLPIKTTIKKETFQ
jgi:hypothetical protein